MKDISQLGLKLESDPEKTAYQKVLSHPDRPDGYRALARLLKKGADRERAEAVLSLAESLFPDDRLTLEELSVHCEETGRTDRAVELCRRLIERGDSWAAYTQLARIHKNRGDPAAAVALLQSVPEGHPFKVRTYPVLFALLFVMNDHRRGIQNLEEAIRVCGPSHRLVKDLGRLQMKMGRKQEAIASLARALEYQPDDLDAVKLIGLAHLDVGEYDQARARFREILARQPDSFQAMIQLAELCLHEHKLEEAKEWLDRIRAVQERKGCPADSRSKLALGEYWVKKGEPSRAIPITLEGIRETPFYYPMELRHAYSVLEEACRGVRDDCRTQLCSEIRAALARDPDVFSALTRLAGQLKEKGSLLQAKEILEHLLLTFPGNALILVELAETQFRRGMFESAVQIARAAARAPAGSFARDRARALKLLSVVHRQMGDEASAAECERQAREIVEK
jgi:tetratricopeptide (TPR) repeat protein